MDIIVECQRYFSFPSPSELTERRKAKFSIAIVVSSKLLPVTGRSR